MPHHFLSKLRDPVRIVPFTSFLGTAAIFWDSWWHVVLGRDSFFIPPHDLLYLTLAIGTAALLLQAYLDRRNLNKIDPRLAVALVASLLIFAAAPFDEFWHNRFGKESLSSILIVWSPPHLISLLSFVISTLAIYCLLLIRKPQSHFLHLLQATPAITAAQFILLPVMPIGLHRILGFAGAGMIAFVNALLLILFARYSGLVGSATLISMLMLAIGSVSTLPEGYSPPSGIPPHSHLPQWLDFFSLLAGGLLIDGLHKKIPGWFTGLLYGLVTSAILYVPGRYFIEPNFAYGAQAAFVALVSSSAGGLLAGLFLRRKNSWR